MILVLDEGLCQIADSLPRIGSAPALHHTTQMQQAIAQIYARIIRFLVRAQRWYESRATRHILHTIERLTELRFKDIIEDINRSVDSVAAIHNVQEPSASRAIVVDNAAV